MMRTFSLAVVFCCIFLVTSARQTLAQTADLQTDFTYQGYLSNAGGAVNASCNFQFSLFDAAVLGNPIGTMQQVSSVAVNNGAFSVQLDFGAGTFNGQDRFLEIAVQCPGDTEFTTLIPRQPVTPAPYAGYALSVPWLGITGAPLGFADGMDNEGWTLTGNAGTTPGTHFIGTTDNVALEFFVNSLRALRIEPVDNGSVSGNNIIGGYGGNTIINGAVGATVFGGGQDSAGSATFPNSVSGDFGTVSGGYNNTSGETATVGGGTENTASGFLATVSGGFINTSSGFLATVSGGGGNTSSNFYATVGGGDNNAASAERATIAGGSLNSASGGYTTIGGGYTNTASGLSATVGGGSTNTADGYRATVGGGFSNVTTDDYGTIGGGGENQVGNNDADTTNAMYATVGGGRNNQATAFYTTIAGGRDNIVGANYATVGGGYGNTANGNYSFVAGRLAKNTNVNHDGVFLFGDDTNADFSSVRANEFAARVGGGVRFVVGSTTCSIPNGGGSWSCTSSREAKNGFDMVDTQAVLDAVAAMPITTWRYNNTESLHMGPVAEDFYAAFGLGVDDKSISTVDADGVALAAIQGLYEIVQEKEAQINQQQMMILGLAGAVLGLMILEMRRWFNGKGTGQKVGVC